MKTIDPGEGYELLKEGDAIVPFETEFCPGRFWYPVEDVVPFYSRWNARDMYPMRRRIEVKNESAN